MIQEKKPRILVQEDAPQIARIIHFKLTYEGYAVDVTEDGESTLKAVNERSPSLLVLDADVPGITGWDVLRRLRSHEGMPLPPASATTGAASDVQAGGGATFPLPVILLLENEERGRVEEAVALGASDVLVKPFRPTQLAKKVKALLSRVAAPGPAVALDRN